MKKVILLFIISLSLSAKAKELTKLEIEKVTSDVHSIIDSFNKGDEKVLTQKSHVSIIKLMGGKDRFSQLLKTQMKTLADIGIKYQHIKIGPPSKLYQAGEEEICFVPSQLILTMQKRKFKNLGYMVAARKVGTMNWSYVDGAGIHKNKKLLWGLFPKLEKSIEFPEYKREEIK